MFRLNRTGKIALTCILIVLAFGIEYFFLLNPSNTIIIGLPSQNIPDYIPDTSASKFPTWIWYPGDFELQLHNKVSIRRTQKGIPVPPNIRMDNYYQNVQFKKDFLLKNTDTVEIFAEGIFNVQLDENYLYNNFKTLVIPAGKHSLLISVYNDLSVPTIFVKGKQLNSDTSWSVSCYDKKWVKAGYWNFNAGDKLPSKFKLPTTEEQAYKYTISPANFFVDFGKETFGYLKIKKRSGKGKVRINYGESLEEANSGDCETSDEIDFANTTSEVYVNPASRAFRYVNLKLDKNITIDSVSVFYEYLPEQKIGKFESSSEKLNKIWNVAAYTLELNTREFFLDGIKRDRWVWSGDATECYLMNYYLYFDKEINKRTIIALRGKDPVDTHINTILDYSFYWFNGIYDYYQYTGDIGFVKQIYPKMVTLMDFCINRRNPSGFVEGLKDDWVFIDWAKMDKTGELSVEQILFCKALESTAYFSDLLNDKENSKKYSDLSVNLKEKINTVFWSASKNCYMHSRKGNTISPDITRYSNIFAVLYNYANSSQKSSICKNVLMNDNILKITTPYMKFYELSAIAECGQYDKVISDIENYWGGMLDMGATTFWESYNPEEKGLQHYSNGYPDRPFAKSLCHAWSASPIYLLGRYFLGVNPTAPGYAKFNIEPHLAKLEYIKGTVPMPNGIAEIYMDKNKIKIKTNCSGGTLSFDSRTKPESNFGTVSNISENKYSLAIEKNKEYLIKFQNTEQ